MGERDRHEHGTFSWTDLSTPDAEASKRFYGGLFPWEFEDNPIPDDAPVTTAKGRVATAMFAPCSRASRRLQRACRRPRAIGEVG